MLHLTSRNSILIVSKVDKLKMDDFQLILVYLYGIDIQIHHGIGLFVNNHTKTVIQNRKDIHDICELKAQVGFFDCLHLWVCSGKPLADLESKLRV